MNPSRSRPGGITILGILAVIVGLLGLVGGAILLTSADPFTLALSALAVVIGLVYLATGYGFLTGAGWSWNLGIAVSVLSIIRNAIEAAGGGLVYALPGLIVPILILYYLTRPTVKSYFVHQPTPIPAS